MIIDNKRLTYIQINYPVTYKWIKFMAKSNNTTIGAVLNRFECEIDESIADENEANMKYLKERYINSD